MKFSGLKAGMTIYDIQSGRMRNTTMTTLRLYEVHVLELDAEKERAFASWNTNAPKWYSAEQIKGWKKNKPLLIRSPMGSYRKATKEEKLEAGKSL